MEDKNKQEKSEIQKEKTRQTNREMFLALELVSKLGISIALIAGIFLYIGIYLDKLFNTRYVFVVIFLFLSIIASIYDIYILLEPIIGSDKRKNFLKRKK